MSTEDQQVYRVGELTDPRDTDPTLAGWDAAMAEAERQYYAQNQWDDRVIGVWLWEDNGARTQLEGIYYEGTLFTP